MTTLWSRPDRDDWAGARGSQHWTSNLVLHGDTHAAVGRSYLLIVSPRRATAEIIVVGHYSDRFRKGDGEWLFERRVLRHWPPDEVNEKISAATATPSS